MTVTQQIITVAVVVFATMLTRYIPFVVFPAGKPSRNTFHISERCFLPQFSDCLWFTVSKM